MHVPIYIQIMHLNKECLRARSRKGRREYLNDAKTKEMMRELNEYFDTKIELPLIRHGKRQRIETLINEETLLLAKYIRNEKNEWIPRISYKNSICEE
jgi:hypothetical protein